ncbi:SDR family NAD(P)-dependent oxidoreductase [Curtobacterium sp. MCBD17_040]|uniref:SDR family NAD(P)-dependent oxidoreductase n=1 Tax=Curtobacterium sp. MCBD17_040 TaxID=2175674 RepID=UPI000DA7A01E|nr:SDR family NAD(P)-dependent oxidoreductase [Curtobacterium sp. MCBD17_040]WIB65848.1 SDR family NAD(P)-dependent oxidoreductase [Curtobacterium sp. MCBD17_040]
MPRRRVVLVVGGSSGIGSAVAARFAADGDLVIAASRTRGSTPPNVEYRYVDVLRPGTVTDLVAGVVDDHGGLDVAINAAGVPSWRAVADLSESEWSSIIDTNLNGAWRCMQAEMQAMRGRDGCIVNISSRIGRHLRLPMQGAYAAAKAGLTALTATAARESIGDGIRINTVSPGAIDTGMSLWPDETPEMAAARVTVTVPAGRLGSPAEVAAAVAWLCSPEAAFVVGADLVIDGGSSA